MTPRTSEPCFSNSNFHICKTSVTLELMGELDSISCVKQCSSPFIINAQYILLILIITIDAAAGAALILITGQPCGTPGALGREALGCSCQVPVPIVGHLHVRHLV